MGQWSQNLTSTTADGRPLPARGVERQHCRVPVLDDGNRRERTEHRTSGGQASGNDGDNASPTCRRTPVIRVIPSRSTVGVVRHASRRAGLGVTGQWRGEERCGTAIPAGNGRRAPCRSGVGCLEHGLHSREPSIPLALTLSLDERRNQLERTNGVGLGVEVDSRSGARVLEREDCSGSDRPEDRLELDLSVGLDGRKASCRLPGPAKHLLAKPERCSRLGRPIRCLHNRQEFRVHPRGVFVEIQKEAETPPPADVRSPPWTRSSTPCATPPTRLDGERA